MPAAIKASGWSLGMYPAALTTRRNRKRRSAAVFTMQTAWGMAATSSTTSISVG